jgi:hypothetical protein
MMKKAEHYLGDANDVTLGSSAIFENRILRKRRINQDTGPDETVETRGFPSPSYGGFGFIKDWK